VDAIVYKKIEGILSLIGDQRTKAANYVACDVVQC